MNEPEAKPKRFSLWRLLPLAVIVGGLVLALAMGWHNYLTLDTLRENREALLKWRDANLLVAAVTFCGVYALVAAFSIPGGAILTIGGGFLFGIWQGTAYVVVAATVGASALFLAARYALGDLLKAKAGGAIRKMEAGFRENALSYLLVLRLVPLFPFWLVNLVPAFLGVRLRTYLLGTFVGIIPGTAVYATVGAGVGAVIDRGEEPNLAAILEPEVLAALIGLAVLSLVPVVYKRMKGRRSAAPKSAE